MEKNPSIRPIEKLENDSNQIMIDINKEGLFNNNKRRNKNRKIFSSNKKENCILKLHKNTKIQNSKMPRNFSFNQSRKINIDKKKHNRILFAEKNIKNNYVILNDFIFN